MTDFEQLYHTYFNDVYLYIRKLSGDEHIAEEITSDTFLKAMKSIDKFRGDCEVRVWLCQIAKNSYYSYIKKTDKTIITIDTNIVFHNIISTAAIINKNSAITNLIIEPNGIMYFFIFSTLLTVCFSTYSQHQKMQLSPYSTSYSMMS